MLFLDLNVRKKTHLMDYNTEEIVVSCEHILEKSYAEYTRMFEKVINSLELKDNTLYDIELQTSDKLEEADLMQFHQCLIGLLVSRIAEKEPRNTEERLAVEQNWVYVNNIALRKLVNFKTKINCFNLVLRCKGKVIDMTGGYYVESGI